MTGKKDELPDWVSGEIKNAKFDEPSVKKGTGYILEIYKQHNKIDVQLYDPIEDGRHIVTMDLSKDIKSSNLQKGIIYEFTFDQLKAPLDGKVTEYLQSQMGLDMQAIYQFELKSLKVIDENSGNV